MLDNLFVKLLITTRFNLIITRNCENEEKACNTNEIK